MASEVFLPTYDRQSRHQVDIAAPPTEVWPHVRQLDLIASPIVRGLFTLRGMRRVKTSIQFEETSATILAEDPPNHLVLGLIGRFWRPRGGLVRFEAAEFTEFDEPGYAKATLSFELEPIETGTRLVTETRVLCTDEASRRSLNRYWRFIRPFSGLTRREILRTIRNQAEGA